ncbi:MAG: hypothetical protein R8F63_01185 [Acidimicrobiales bacterium]|nr:hypothetical protein [Acidimicrobiales bacterium]
MSDNGNAEIPVDDDEFDAFVVRAMLDAGPASVDANVRAAEISAAVAAAEVPLGEDAAESGVGDEEPDDMDPDDMGEALEAAREREIDALLDDDLDLPAVDADFELPPDFSEPVSTLADAVDDGFAEPELDDVDVDDDDPDGL